MSEIIVILSSYQFFYCSRVDAKAFGWASMIPLSHLSFAQGGQVKCLPKKKVIIKVSHNVVAEGTVCVCGGGGGGGVQRPSGMTGISAISLI